MGELTSPQPHGGFTHSGHRRAKHAARRAERDNALLLAQCRSRQPRGRLDQVKPVKLRILLCSVQAQVKRIQWFEGLHGAGEGRPGPAMWTRLCLWSVVGACFGVAHAAIFSQLESVRHVGLCLGECAGKPVHKSTSNMQWRARIIICTHACPQCIQSRTSLTRHIFDWQESPRLNCHEIESH